jgi:hypothetical protein
LNSGRAKKIGTLQIVTKAINGAIVAYSLMVIGMGVQAYFFPSEGKDPSSVSLMASSAIGLLMLGSLGLWTKNPRAGRIMSLVLAIAAFGRFIGVFMKDKAIYPAGVVVLTSLILIGLLGFGHMAASKAKKQEAQD